MRKIEPVIYSNTLPVASSCLSTIELECNKNPNNETIGLLVGTCARPVIHYAFPAGPETEKETFRCSNDPDFDQLLLRIVQHHHQNKVHVLGYWHKHPGYFNTPSKGDLRQAVRMVKEEGWDLSVGPLLACIVTKDRLKNSDKWCVHAYQLRKDLTGFDRLEIDWLDNTHPDIVDSLKHEYSKTYTKKPNSKQSDFSSVLSWFNEEFTLLKALGFEIKTFFSNELKYAALYISRSEKTYAYVFTIVSKSCSEILIDLNRQKVQNRIMHVQRKTNEGLYPMIQRCCSENKVNSLFA
jgi:proteasome lid subunit RPN8/RPN11